MRLLLAVLFMVFACPLWAAEDQALPFRLELMTYTSGILAAPYRLEIMLIRRNSVPWTIDGKPFSDDGKLVLPGQWDLVLEEISWAFVGTGNTARMEEKVLSHRSLKPAQAARAEPFPIPLDRYVRNSWSIEAKDLFTHAGDYRFTVSYGALQRSGPPIHIRDTVVPPWIAVTATPDKSRAMLGEPIRVDIAVENHGAETFHAQFGGDDRGTTRPLRFYFTAVRADGETCRDPEPIQFGMGGMEGSGDLKPGGRMHEEVMLGAYVRFRGPGTYTVTAYHALEFGVPVPVAAGPCSGYGPLALAGTFTLVIDPPDPQGIARVVHEMLQPAPTAAERWPRAAHLHQPCFLDALREAFAHATAVDDACLVIDAIHSIATIGATQALITCAQDERPAVRGHALEALITRVPPVKRPFGAMPTPGQLDLARIEADRRRPMWDGRLVGPIQRFIQQELLRHDPATLAPVYDLIAELALPGAGEILADEGDRLMPTAPAADGSRRGGTSPTDDARLFNRLEGAAYHLGSNDGSACRADAAATPGRLIVWAHLTLGLKRASTPESDALFVAMVTSPSALLRRTALLTMPRDLPRRVTMPWQSLFMEPDGSDDWRFALSLAGEAPAEAVAAALRACRRTEWGEPKRKAFADLLEDLQVR